VNDENVDLHQVISVVARLPAPQQLQLQVSEPQLANLAQLLSFRLKYQKSLRYLLPNISSYLFLIFDILCFVKLVGSNYITEVGSTDLCI
jgi:hypothetical protein